MDGAEDIFWRSPHQNGAFEEGTAGPVLDYLLQWGPLFIVALTLDLPFSAGTFVGINPRDLRILFRRPVAFLVLEWDLTSGPSHQQGLWKAGKEFSGGPDPLRISNIRPACP